VKSAKYQWRRNGGNENNSNGGKNSRQNCAGVTWEAGSIEGIMKTAYLKLMAYGMARSISISSISILPPHLSKVSAARSRSEKKNNGR